MRRGLLFICLCFLTLHSHAQDSVRKSQLKTVNIPSTRNTTTYKTQSKSYTYFDSTTIQQYQFRTMRDLLEENSNAFIKNYGVSTVSTISIRGSSAAQTKVDWYGVNVNSAANGLTDFSVLPIGLFDQIAVSSNEPHQIGGALLLRNAEPVYKHDANLRLGIGYESLGNTHLVFSQQSSGKTWHIQNKLVLGQAKNRFEFNHPLLGTPYTLTHAQSQQFSLLSDFYRKIRKNQEVGIHLWYNAFNRQLPPTLYESISEKIENGNSFRSILEWKTKSKNDLQNLQASLGFIRDAYAYQDSAIQLYASSYAYQVPFRVNTQQKFGKHHTFFLEANANYAQLSHQSDANILRSGWQAHYTYTLPKIKFNLQLFAQKEWSNRFAVPWSYGISLAKSTKYGLRFFSNLHQSYRLPTLNELYFQPGGNLNLKPEKSKNAELGLHWQQTKGKINWETEGTAYVRRVEHWILWYGNAILTPHNIAVVRSYGLDYKAQLNWRLARRISGRKETDQERDIMLRTSLLYAYTISTTEQNDLQNDYAVGKQIPYVPRYLFKYQIGIVHPKWDLTYIRNYTGYRFTTTDESEFLLPYTVHHVRLGLNTNTRQYRIHWQAQLNNILNSYYEGIRGRVMPGRNVSINVVFEPIRKNCCKKM